MMRFRRYRVYAALSFVIVFLLYKSSNQTNWELDWKNSPPPPGGSYTEKNPDWHRNPETYRNKLETNINGKGGAAEEKPLNNAEAPDTTVATTEEPTRAPALAETKTAKPPPAHNSADALGHIHWQPQPENFPLSIEEIIALPTGPAEPIPRIQFNFGEEDAETKSIREKRLAEVKAEMQHAWKGYTKYAWGHDELKPVSLESKDPFCGWAATLVDSLDTLWIMGMKQEFDTAVKAVGEIDFTYSAHRAEIPVFETTIRYLGGLIGAYDLSGGVSTNEKYAILLDKAGELAEILMGIFDTPNRMPILYYDYKPQSVASPKMAPSRAGVAEVGSLLMEFTRLAQLSGKNKYYDATARITNALDDLGERGTAFPGLFPETIDISGCNRTAPEEKVPETQQVTPGLDPALSKDSEKRDSRDASTSYKGAETSESSKIEEQAKKRGSESSGKSSADSNKKKGPTVSPRSPPESFMNNCYYQPIVSTGFGSESYSIGGSQDSTYEYFPKEYLLLGAKEAQYKRLSIEALEATKNHLLFRPMIPDERDILFAAKITTRRSGNPEYTFESTHLACFIGGMFGMAGKIFDSEEYVDIGKRLTDGCVWAYESLPNGIMAEDSRLVPCKDQSNCAWNETIWHAWLDPMGESRDQKQKEYDEVKSLTLEQQQVEEPVEVEIPAEEDEEVRKVEKESSGLRQAKQFAGAVEAEAARQAKLSPQQSHKAPITNEDIEKEAERLIANSAERGASPSEKRGDKAISYENERPTLQRRMMPTEMHDVTAVGESTAEGGIKKAIQVSEDEDELSTPAPKSKEEAEALAAQPPPVIEESKKTSGRSEQPVDSYDPETDPARPLNHTQFATKRIRDEGLPGGFVSIPGKNYILRPEAIESVWYMYRITGDKIWQEKGWNMFQSIIKVTKTEAGHSAIRDVTAKKPPQSDSMESFWLAETLKYFYLLFAEPDVVSLDDWVLNTEAHPFKIPKA